MSLIDIPTIIDNSKLIVIKVGSMLVRGGNIDQVNQRWLDALAQDISEIKKTGINVVIVSSGGVALGRKALNIRDDVSPSSIPLAKKQAASSVGQYHLFNGYFKAFEKQGHIAAQVLLTMSETENRRMHLNARETIYTLLEHNIVPVINENDTVSTGEIRFGDNDRLSVRVAQMIGADCVVLLSTANGLYTDNPQDNPQAVHIPIIEQITDAHLKMAGDAISGLSTGGMKSKIEAAMSSVSTGIHMVMTDGYQDHCLKKLCEDASKKHSIFVAQKTSENARKVWLRAHMRPQGIIIVDDGAVAALKKGKSLLPIGISEVSGEFSRGDVVEIQSLAGEKLGMGLSAYKRSDSDMVIGKNKDEIAIILGYAGRNEFIHRNDMVLEI